MKGKKRELTLRGDVIMTAAEAGMDAVMKVLNESGAATAAEISCITTLLRDMLMNTTARAMRISEIDMFLATFGDKLMS